MNTHTPGPWWHTEEPDYDGTFFAIRNNRGYLIATTAVHDLTPDREANARLIAAAPELLEALKAMMRHFTIMCNGRWEVMEWVDDERWTSVGPFYDTQEEAETELAILKRDIAASARAAISKATNA